MNIKNLETRLKKHDTTKAVEILKNEKKDFNVLDVIKKTKEIKENNFILDYVLKNGGATLYDSDIYEPSNGYAVALTNNIIDIKDFNIKNFKSGIKGLWIDIESGLLYIDTVVIIEELESALLIAKKLKQLEIYNFNTKECIKVAQMLTFEESVKITKRNRYKG